MLPFSVLEIHNHGDEYVITLMATTRRYYDAEAVLNRIRSGVIVEGDQILLERAINPTQYTKIKEYIENAPK